MKLRVHGLPNCDTVKRARAWLAEQGIVHAFVDFKKVGAQPADLDRWCQAVGWERLLNRQGSTWRQLAPSVQATVVDGPTAVSLMAAYPSVIKRPVTEWHDGVVTLGFSTVVWLQRAVAAET